MAAGLTLFGVGAIINLISLTVAKATAAAAAAGLLNGTLVKMAALVLPAS